MMVRKCSIGETGRHARLRTSCRKTCGFKSLIEHHYCDMGAYSVKDTGQSVKLLLKAGWVQYPELPPIWCMESDGLDARL